MATRSISKRSSHSSRSQKQSNKEESALDNAKYVGHVSYYVDNSIKATVRDSKLDAVSVLQGLAELAELGYRYSIEYDYRSFAYAASLFCRNPTHDNAGWILTARHSDRDIANLLLFTLHNEVFDGGIWPKGSPESQYDW